MARKAKPRPLNCPYQLFVLFAEQRDIFNVFFGSSVIFSVICSRSVNANMPLGAT